MMKVGLKSVNRKDETYFSTGPRDNKDDKQQNLQEVDLQERRYLSSVYLLAYPKGIKL